MNTNLAREEVVDNVVANIYALPTVTKETTGLHQKREALVYKFLKRIVDIIGTLFGVIMLVPMTIGIYIANLIVGDKGPIFYSQNRIGKDGKNFKMYKFRSMVMGADEKLEKYLQENEDARKEYKINKKLKDDPRVTKIGKFIRKTSIDEFPQFINVLKGEMSLVGPRPYLPREINDMGYAYQYITAVKPGVTGLCEKVCPILNQVKVENKPVAYAVKNLEEEIREQSSSGGMFTLLAESILDDGGVVFGAAFDENWQLKHTYVENVEKLQIFRGSKYFQSTVGSTYAKVKEFLDSGRKVMFTGTPCQIEGLKAYLGKENDNLFTQDIICHGVPSPKVHRIYIEFLRKVLGISKIESIQHRSKKNGWKDFCTYIKFDNSEYIKSHNDDPYMQAFLRNTSLRESCYNCHFKKRNRISDITLADFWGIENIAPEMDDDKGTSLVIINSEKGKQIFEQIKDKIMYKEVDFEEAIRYNPSMTSSVKKDPNMENFFENLDKMPFDELVKKYTYTPSIIKRIYWKVKRITKKVIRKI